MNNIVFSKNFGEDDIYQHLLPADKVQEHHFFNENNFLTASYTEGKYDLKRWPDSHELPVGVKNATNMKFVYKLGK